MDRYKETSETWNKIARLYQDGFMDLDLYNDSYDYFCSFIVKEHAKILEIGCGPGNITRHVLSKRPDFNILGIDIAPKMVDLARQNNPAARFLTMDCREISRLNDKFDGIICGFCLPYLSPPDSEKLINDCNDLMNEGGMFYLSYVEGDPDKSDFQVTGSGDRVWFNYYNPDELQMQLVRNNFSEINTFNIQFEKLNKVKELHTIITARKRGI